MNDIKKNIQSLQPFGKALVDYVNGNKATILILHRDDGFIEDLPISTFFRGISELSPLETLALKLCEGKILDVGAGAGCHSVVLQENGLNVYSLDVIPEACRIMKQRGLRNVICSDFFNFTGLKFDTLLLLGRSICMVGDLDGLDKFLNHTYTLLEDNGKIILDSIDVKMTNEPKHLEYHKVNLRNRRYIGEIRLFFEYQGFQGEPYQILHIEPNVLIERAVRKGFSCRILNELDNGSYLACLQKSKN